MKENELPTARVPLSKTPVLEVTVWAMLSLFVQITVVPAFTCKLEGWKDKLMMETLAVVGVAVGVAAVLENVNVDIMVEKTADSAAASKSGGGVWYTPGLVE